MILIDFNGLVVGMLAQSKEELGEDLVRHIVLNQLRMYSHMFKKDYGETVICCEGRSWRKEIFPNYKYRRAVDREASKTDWPAVYALLNQILDEVRENTPYRVLQHSRAEADDIIGTLCEMTQEFGRHDDIMIVSNDHDFKQLQRYNNVKQFAPSKKKLVVEDHPLKYLVEHIVTGDRGDGVPNILSPDDSFVTGIKQRPARKTLVEKVIEANDPADVLNTEELRNYQRNQKLVDLRECPQDIKDEIIEQYDACEPAPRAKLLNYLIAKRCKLLIDVIEEF